MVRPRKPYSPGRLFGRGQVAALAALAAAGALCAAPAISQQPNSLPDAPSAVHAAEFAQATSAAASGLASGRPEFGGNAVVQPASPDVLPLTLDDAISRGLQRNLQMQLATETERTIRGEVLSIGNYLLPNLKLTAYTTAEELNLAAMGFKPSSLAAFGFPPGLIQEIVKVNVTDAQVSLDQPVFNLPDFYLFSAARKAADVAQWNTLNTRGGVIDAVATQYLATLADEAQIANTQALVDSDQEQLRQATLSHEAGVGTNLDVLRAQVQLQTEQQTLISAQNTFDKDKIALNRLIGLPAGQPITLTDKVPYAEFEAMPLEQAKTIAYQRRKDLLALQSQLEIARRVRKATRYERLPQLAFSGYYGVLGETTGMYHGVFTAEGVLKIPLFEEGRFRGETEIAAAQEAGLQSQIDSLKQTIEEQIRASMLDVQSSAQLVKVAQSNVDLAREELADTRDRFAAGVTDNLPVVQAQASLAGAESQLVATQFAYNHAKLELARNSGVIEIEYRQFLGR